MEAAEQYKNSGNAAMAQQRYHDAVAEYSRAIELSPTNSIFFSNRSAAYLHLQNYAEALRDADTCIRLSPEWAKGYWRRGTVLSQMGELTSALAALKRSIDIDPTQKQAAAEMALVQSRLADGEKDAMYDGKRPSFQSDKSGGDQSASSAAAAAAKSTTVLQGAVTPVVSRQLPSWHSAAASGGSIMNGHSVEQESQEREDSLASGDNSKRDRLLDAMAAASFASPQKPRTHEISNNNNNTGSASLPSIGNKPLSSAPPPPSDKPVVIAAASERRPPADEIQPSASSVSEAQSPKPQTPNLDPPKSDALTIGKSASRNGEYEAAFNAFTALINANPNDSQAYELRGQTRLDIARKSNFAAIEDAKRAQKMQPESANAYALEGDAHMALLEYDLAVDSFSIAARLDPAFRPLLQAAKQLRQSQCLEAALEGSVAFASGDYEAAIGMFHRALEIDSENRNVLYLRSLSFSAKKMVANALSDAEACIRISSNWAEGHAAKGSALTAANDLENAVKSWQLAASLDPKFAPASHELHRKLAALKAPQEAPISQATNKVQAAAEAGVEAMRAMNFTAAIEHYTAAIQSEPTNHILFSNRCAAYLHANMLSNAIKDADRCIELVPNWAKGYARRGAVQMQQGDYASAVVSFTKASQLDQLFAADLTTAKQMLAQKLSPPSVPSVQSETSSLSSSQGQNTSPNSTNSDSRIALDSAAAGTAALQAREFDKAVRQYTCAIALDPNNHLLHSNRCAAFLSMRMYNEALADANKCVSINPKWPKGHARVGAALIGLGDLKAARNAYLTAASIDPKYFPEVQSIEKAIAESEATKSRGSPTSLSESNKRIAAEAARLGSQALHNNDIESSIMHYTRAISADSGNHVLYSNRCAVYLTVLMLDEALQDANKCIELAPHWAKGYVRQGAVYARSGDHIRAVQSYTRAAQLDPQFIPDLKQAEIAARSAMKTPQEEFIEASENGIRALQNKNYQQAIAHFTTALNIDPNSTQLWSNRCAAYTGLLMHKEALADAHKIISLDPDSPQGYGYAGDLSLQLGNYKSSVEFLTRAIEKDPANIRYRSMLQDAQRLLKGNYLMA